MNAWTPRRFSFPDGDCSGPPSSSIGDRSLWPGRAWSVRSAEYRLAPWPRRSSAGRSSPLGRGSRRCGTTFRGFSPSRCPSSISTSTASGRRSSSPAPRGIQCCHRSRSSTRFSPSRSRWVCRRDGGRCAPLSTVSSSWASGSWEARWLAASPSWSTPAPDRWNHSADGRCGRGDLGGGSRPGGHPRRLSCSRKLTWSCLLRRSMQRSNG